MLRSEFLWQLSVPKLESYPHPLGKIDGEINLTFFGIPKMPHVWHSSGLWAQGGKCGLFRDLGPRGVNVAFFGIYFQLFQKLSQINCKCHFSTLNHIFCFGTVLQVDSNSGEGCAGFSEKAFGLCKS